MTTTTPAAAPSVKQIALGDLENELALVRRVLERVPEERLGWKPHEKSMSLGGLATHLANLLSWSRAILEEDGFDIAAAPPPRQPVESREQLLREFDENTGELRRRLNAADDGALLAPWTLRRGEHVVMRLPRVGILRAMIISHLIHHRAQLGVYLRLLNVPVPAIYGPSADEHGGG